MVRGILKTDLNIFLKIIMTNLLHGVNATGYKLGLLINFGRPKIEIKRIAH